MAEVLILSNPPPEPGAFCETATAAAIKNLIKVCHHKGWMGAVVGDPGIGKTVTLQHYAETVDTAWYCTISAAFASVSGTLDRLGELVDAYPVLRGAAPKHAAIVHAIRGKMGKAMLLIDEAQEMSPAALQNVKGIHDETGIAIVLAGNPHVINQFYDRSGGRKRVKPAFAQIDRRIVIRRHFRTPTPQDVEALAGHHGIGDPKARAFLQRHATVGHGLARPARLMDLGRDLAGNQPVTCQHLQHAAEIMGV